MTFEAFITTFFISLRHGSIVALATLGIVLIYRTSKATNFAQGMIGTFNAYVAGYLMIHHGASIWVATLVALITAFITGVIIDKLFIRPASKSSAVGKQIMTLGIILILVGIMNMNFGLIGRVTNTNNRVTRFIPTTQTVSIFGQNIPWDTVFVTVLAMVLMGAIFWFIQKTRWGLGVRVTASNEPVARLMGVPTRTITMLSWSVAAMLGTIAGIALASTQGGITVGLLIGVQISAFFAAVLGGFQTFHGPVIMAYVLGFTLRMSRYIMMTVFAQSSVLADALIYTLVLVVLYFMPYGIFGKAPVRKV